MTDVLERGLGIPIDFWAMVDLDQFGDLVDAIGGVPIDLPCDMDYEDSEQDLYIHLKKGQQVLDGDSAEKYIRFRKGNNGYAQGDIGRVDAMKVFMSALCRQIKNNLSISTVPKLAETAINMVNTDMKVLDCVYFGKNFMKNVDMSNVNFVTLPGEAVNAGTSYYVMNKAGMLKLMNEYFNPYKIEITDALFDPTGMFGKNADESISSVYKAPVSEKLESSVHNASDINDNGLEHRTYRQQKQLIRRYGKSDRIYQFKNLTEALTAEWLRCGTCTVQRRIYVRRYSRSMRRRAVSRYI